jgi:hypothetical protein
MDDNLDRILNEGIAEYAKSEPLTGIEQRILARVQFAKGPRRLVAGWGLIPAGAAVVAGLAIMLLLPHREQPRPVYQVAVNRPLALPPPLAEKAAMPKPARHLAKRKMLPKLAVFPTPSPLTEEERRLIAMVKHDPKGTAEEFESLRKRNQPIEIAPLVIEPLETASGQ